MEMLWTLIDLVQTTRQFARHATGHHSLLSSLSNAKCVFVTFFLAISMIHHQIVCGYDTFEIYVKNPKHLISQLISAAISMEQALSILPISCLDHCSKARYQPLNPNARGPLDIMQPKIDQLLTLASFCGSNKHMQLSLSMVSEPCTIYFHTSSMSNLFMCCQTSFTLLKTLLH